MSPEQPQRLLLDLLARPQAATSLTPGQWETLLCQARAANLIGTLAERVDAAGIPLPDGLARHLRGVAQLSARQRESVLWEAHLLDRCLAPLGIPVVLLKGSAYVLRQLPVARGRLFGDIDILVPREHLGAVEVAMMTAGWTSAKLHPYDQRYYRQWMHELPPMLNVRRGTILDIHHTLLPLTSRHHPDPALLFAAAEALPGFSCLRTPSPADLVIHSITHLFHEGEFHNGLRDLVDIDGLLRHFAARDAGFWDGLVPRARQLQLASPLFLGLHFAQHVLASPIPPAVLAAAAAAGAPSAPGLRLLETLFSHALRPQHPRCLGPMSGFALWLLYVRAHWLRMPPHLLTVHLTRKAWRSVFPEPERTRHDDEPGLPG
ncbi:MAG: nucleotidyltransferase family protein [Azonexus sp.]|nr:nucleotidyltransferase family protein [Betaproteobacteria bacterium]MBK8918948.1 nucleotidyltransferase family protein [Betaproteobacteria bacterium]MBP6035762.1 nucleotidyltransferase family protein [Azonexus sp.]MBP6905399.1 nucleotidyltransferase family protein [Azonexus sp.]